MKYAIIDAAKAEEYGIKASHHRSSDAGKKIVVNENELLMLGKRLGMDKNLDVVEMLGGDTLLPHMEVRLKTMRWKNRK